MSIINTYMLAVLVALHAYVITYKEWMILVYTVDMYLHGFDSLIQSMLLHLFH